MSKTCGECRHFMVSDEGQCELHDCEWGFADNDSCKEFESKTEAKDKEIEKLKSENDELQYIVEQFREWYNENGCPKKHNSDFPCSAEKEYKEDPETEGDFDETDCWKEEYEHGCWVEYYRWKFQQKNNTTDTVKEGDDG